MMLYCKIKCDIAVYITEATVLRHPDGMYYSIILYRTSSVVALKPAYYTMCMFTLLKFVNRAAEIVLYI